MQRRTAGPTTDVFEAFAHRVDDEGAHAPSAGTLARSLGVTIGLMVLTALGFVAGAWLASRATPELAWINPLWEGLAFLVWCGVWGTLAAVITLSGGVVAVGLPWVRRQRGGRSTSTSSP